MSTLEFILLIVYIIYTITIIAINFFKNFTLLKFFQLLFISLLLIYRLQNKKELSYMPDLILFTLPFFWGFEVAYLYNTIWKNHKIWLFIYSLTLIVICCNYFINKYLYNSNSYIISYNAQNENLSIIELAITISTFITFLEALILSILYPYFTIELFYNIVKITHLFVGNFVIVKTFLNHFNLTKFSINNIFSLKTK